MSTEPLASAPEPSEQATMAHVVPSPTGATRSPSECLPCVGSAGTVPGYELLGELGRGGMGVVYRARQVKANRLVALKMILAGGHAGAAELARFRTEAEAIARLQHPNIVQVHEVGEHEGKPFFSLEFCGGGSLAQKLNGTPLPAREAAELVKALARAMQAAHARGVIHRDLKPANVLLAEDGTPKVTDFGLAKKLDEAGQTQSGAVLGTPSYMAPEQAAGKGKEIGPLADVYALGAILYECLTGRPPFRAATALDTILQVVNDEPVPPSQLQSKTPRDLETVCLKCLRKEPAKRYASAADLAEDLRRWQAGEPITARPVGRVERGVKWVRRNPVVTSLLAAVVLAVAGGGAGVYWKYLDAKEQAENARKQTAIAEGKTRELEDTLAEGWLLHVGYEETPTPAELAALRQLAETPNERVRLLFLEKALERPESAVRLRRRAELAAHAVVGLDRDREGRVVELLRAKLRDNAADAEVRVACVHFGLALQTKDEVFRGELVKAAAELLEPNGDPEALLALAVALGTLAERERLPPDQAAEAARYALGFLTVSTDFLLQCAAAQVTMDLARHLGLEQAAAVGPLVLDALAHTEDPLVRGLLAQAVAKVAERMGPGPGAELSARAVPHLLATPADAHNAPVPREEALTDLARQLGPEQAAALAQQVLSAMKKAKPDALVFLALALSKLADRPEPTQAAELSAAAAPLVFDARAKVRDPRVKASLARALEDLAERLGPERAAPFAQAVLAAMTQPADAADLGPVLAVLAGRLGPERAAELLAQAAPLVFDALAKPDNAGFRDSLIRAAKKLARRMEPGQAAKAARQTLDTVGKGADPALYATAALLETLAERLEPDQVVPFAQAVLDRLAGAHPAVVYHLAPVLEKLAQRGGPDRAGEIVRAVLGAMTRPDDPRAVGILALLVAELAERLPPDQAANFRGRAVSAVLDALARPVVAADRVDTALRLAEAGTTLARRLGPEQAAALSAKVAQHLLDVMDGNANADSRARLAEALAPVAERLKPDETADLCARAAQRLIDAVPKAGDQNQIPLAAALGKIAPRLKPEQAAVLAPRYLEVLTQTPIVPNRLPTLADALGKLARRMEPDEAARLADLLLDAMTRTVDARPALPRALGMLAGQLEPDRAAGLAQSLLNTLARTSDPKTRAALAQALGELAQRLPPEQSAALSVRAAQELLDAAHRTPDPAARAEIWAALSALAGRISTEGLVELWKHPACVGESGGGLVFKELNRRLGAPAPEAAPLTAAAGLVAGEALYPSGRRPFAGQWDAAEALRQRHPELDLAAPPRKAAR